jgi:uncharacterized protein (DUF58 family)
LRRFRPGDDPRAIHWKQTARTGQLIYMERQADESRRLSILFDNGVGELAGEEQQARFERLVSEAATAAVDYLARRYYVELVARDFALPFGAGERHRRAVLEALALIEPAARRAEPLAGSAPAVPQLRLGFDGGVQPGSAPSPEESASNRRGSQRGRRVAG